MSEQFGYGTRFYKTVSDDLKSILPDVKSFSPTNLKYMRYFYEMYPDAVICPQVEDELITDANRPQVGDDLQIIFKIPWGHNKIPVFLGFGSCFSTVLSLYLRHLLLLHDTLLFPFQDYLLSFPQKPIVKMLSSISYILLHIYKFEHTADNFKFIIFINTIILP